MVASDSGMALRLVNLTSTIGTINAQYTPNTTDENKNNFTKLLQINVAN